jgi:hypothetical protein
LINLDRRNEERKWGAGFSAFLRRAEKRKFLQKSTNSSAERGTLSAENIQKSADFLVYTEKV